MRCIAFITVTTIAVATSSLGMAACAKDKATPVITSSCPDGNGMVRLPEGFCIDRTEVTRGAYFAWLDESPAVATQSPECTANTDFTPTCLTTGGWGLDRYLDNPISCVDWCDAQTYCAAKGKRLCGRIGGGASSFDMYKDATVSEWFAACSAGGQHDYVYGDDYVAHRCYESPSEGWGSTATASFSDCLSPAAAYTGIFDLGGGIAEWEDSCADTGRGLRCRIRGGSFKHSANALRCDAGSTLALGRDFTDDAIGFRCCAD